MAPTAGTILRLKKAGVKPKKKTQSLKNKLRNLERLLKKDTLPDDIRSAKTEELAELQAQVDAKLQQETEREISLKYRKVKFFDRRRIMRTLKKLKAQITATPTKALEDAYEAAKKDMMYIFYYPKGEKYINLFAEKTKKQLSDDELARQNELKEAAIKAYEAQKSHADFDNYCFCDANEPTVAESDDENTKDDDKDDDTAGSKKTKQPKRKLAEAKNKSKRRKQHETNVQVVADTEGNVATGDDDDFFM
ncbi:hypothetical protein SPRG_08824 [Saprolegnia parasitica CBS 223.65]|uniref:rRNA-processing protein EFG1 n=1 Tax=Saprolegnia parasitica (strain CBS 223.65) TaxID=695850 RepID=A0A067CGD5_SAPPC|nr:hypothetical protein SPRG_08824 [Saprolegnia parasitica CBS 223.65]KDO25882.1 hypothetical protein SPRG_08824 [Saprolegnia parasitica CBS 223.65]|eukprot:XP_012203443.1 hypothetical protein SPRG_08824 [Saprolegnia parasitica CBS 223.65]